MTSSTLFFYFAMAFVATVTVTAAESVLKTISRDELQGKLLSYQQTPHNSVTIRGGPLSFTKENPFPPIAPPDDNSATYGDLVGTKDDGTGQKFIERYTYMNTEVKDEEQIVFWYSSPNNYNITEARALNFGRERGWALSVYISNDWTTGFTGVEINMVVPANNTVRMFFEVYGHNKFEEN